MPLRLTLALLWSTACWAAQMYGKGGGWYFSSPGDPEYEISGVRVTMKFDRLTSIQVKYGPSWTDVYGSKLAGTTQEFALYPGEHIIRAYGTHKMFLQSLNLYTDKDRWAVFGKDEGSSFAIYPNGEGKVLTGVCGQYRPLGLTGICLEWDYPLISGPENTTSSEG